LHPVTPVGLEQRLCFAQGHQAVVYPDAFSAHEDDGRTNSQITSINVVSPRRSDRQCDHRCGRDAQGRPASALVTEGAYGVAHFDRRRLSTLAGAGPGWQTNYGAIHCTIL
jgi:hypothetical protein